jgi:hypothetical protein
MVTSWTRRVSNHGNLLRTSQGADPTDHVPGDENALVAAAEAGDRDLTRLLLDAR